MAYAIVQRTSWVCSSAKLRKRVLFVEQGRGPPFPGGVKTYSAGGPAEDGGLRGEVRPHERADRHLRMRGALGRLLPRGELAASFAFDAASSRAQPKTN